MNASEIKAKAQSFGSWYHPVKLLPDFVTAGRMEANNTSLWKAIRQVRSSIDYNHKTVLDIGTMDGMWAFEAEKLGAGRVVATDIWVREPKGRERFEFAIETLASKVQCVPDVDIHNLHHGVQPVLPREGFDIIQCLGVLYHVENPIMAIRQMRQCISPNGLLLLETACWTGHVNDPVVRLNTDNGVYYDSTTYWVPNYTALKAMLMLGGFAIMPEKQQITNQLPNAQAFRVCAACKPL